MRVLILTLSLSMYTVAGCGGESAPTTDAGSESPTWLLASAPPDPLGVVQVKAQAQEGDVVTLRGVIGGRVDAMNEEVASFVIVDTTLENVCVAEDDHCPTPWDYCCATPADVVDHAAAVVLVDEDGSPRAVDLRTFGVEPLDTVVVTGIVGPRTSPKTLTIRASKLYAGGI